MKLWRISKEPQGYFVYRRWYWWPFWCHQNPKEYEIDCTWIKSYKTFREAENRMLDQQFKTNHWYY